MAPPEAVFVHPGIHRPAGDGESVRRLALERPRKSPLQVMGRNRMEEARHHEAVGDAAGLRHRACCLGWGKMVQESEHHDSVEAPGRERQRQRVGSTQWTWADACRLRRLARLHQHRSRPVGPGPERAGRLERCAQSTRAARRVEHGIPRTSRPDRTQDADLVRGTFRCAGGVPVRALAVVVATVCVERREGRDDAPARVPEPGFATQSDREAECGTTTDR
jgi:hypothetical protein